MRFSTDMSETRPKTETLDAASSVELLNPCPDGKGNRRFAMLAYTGAPVDRVYGKFIIDLSGIELRDKIPMLLNHDGDKITGFSDKMAITDRGLELEGVLSKATEYGVMVAQLSDEGFPWQSSVGLDVLAREEVAEGVSCEVNGCTYEGPISIARKSKLPETSFLYSGADSATYAVALSSQTKEALVAEKKIDVREELKGYLKEFPGQEALAAVRFTEGKTIVELKLELAEKDKEALAGARAEIETLKAANVKVTKELETLKSLDTQAGEPGVGFNASSRQTGEVLTQTPGDPKTPKEAYERSESLRAEFPTVEAYEALCRREGFNPKDAK